MIKAITVPKWGLSIEEGELLSWLVAPGDKIGLGQEIAEIETTKITGTVEAQVAGILRKLVAQEQQVLPVGALMAVVTDGDESEQEIDEFIVGFQSAEIESLHNSVSKEVVSGRVALDGVEIFYLDYQAEQGDQAKLPLLLVHGFGGDSGNWLFNAEKLASNRRVVAIDLPGHGQSSKGVIDGTIVGLSKTLRLFLDHLELPRIQVMGHSLGAAVALQLALTESKRVAGLVLICPALMGKAVDPEYLNSFIHERTKKQMKPLLQQLFADSALVTNEMVENLLRYKRLDGVDSALQTIAAASLLQGETAFDADEVERLDKPVLLIWGEQDNVLLEGDTSAVIRRPTAEYWIKHSGHMPHLENSGMLNGFVKQYLSSAD